MKSRQPSKLATWMLKHFGSGPNNDAVVGDLAEHYPRKDSALWYWRQVLKAIPVSFFKEMQDHKRIATSALITGWAMWILWGLSIPPLVDRFIFGRWAFWLNPVLGGGMLGLPLDQSARFQLVNALAYSLAFPLIVGVMCGWVVARFHRDQQTAVVLLFAGSIVLTDLLIFGPSILRTGVPAAYVVNGPLAANITMSVLGILLGGGLLRDNSRAVRN